MLAAARLFRGARPALVATGLRSAASASAPSLSKAVHAAPRSLSLAAYSYSTMSSNLAQAHRARPERNEETPESEVDPTIRILSESETQAVLSKPGVEQGVLYLDSAFPLALGSWDPRRGIAVLEMSQLLDKVKSALSANDVAEHDFRLLGVRARRRDGGAFIYFAYRSSGKASHPDLIQEPTFQTLQNLQRIIQRAFAHSATTTANWTRWLPGRTLGVHIVRGKPWIEDLDQWPSNRLRVKVSGKIVDEQVVWEALRLYGRIRKIETITPGTEYRVIFARLRSAAAAQNCAHQLHLAPRSENTDKGTPIPTIWIKYEQRSRPSEWVQWASAHPRVMVPLILAILGVVSAGLVDPLRTWIVEQRIKDVFDPESYKVWQWIQRTGKHLIQGGDALLGVSSQHAEKDEDSANAELWRDRHAESQALAQMLRQSPKTFITLSGPKGSGKSGLLREALQDNHLVLNLDAEKVSQAGRKGTSVQMGTLAQQTGFWPSFSWLNSVAGMADLAAAGLIGSKPGFSVPPDQQLKQILTVVTQALSQISQDEAKAAMQREKKAAQERARVQVQPQLQTQQASPPSSPKLGQETDAGAEKSKEAVSATGLLGDVFAGAWSTVTSPFLPTQEAPTPGQDQAVEREPIREEIPQVASDTTIADTPNAVKGSDAEDKSGSDDATSVASAAIGGRRYPTVVIRNFHLSGSKEDALYSALAEWAAELVQTGVANVVFVSDSSASMSKDLTRAWPNRPFESITLTDAAPLRARRIVAAKIRELAEQEERRAAQNDSKGISASLQARLATNATLSPVPNSKPNAKAAERLREQLGSSSPDDPFGNLSPTSAHWLDKLGGRQADLEDLMQKVSLGHTVQSATWEIIQRTVVSLRQTFGQDSEEAAQLPWTRPQAWAIMSKLAQQGELPYYGTLHSTFKGQEASLKALEQMEIISVRHVNGRPATILPGRPVFLEAMRALVADSVFAATQTYLANKAKITSDERVITQVEVELKTIKEAGMDSTAAGRRRASFLLGLAGDAQAELENLYDDNIGLLAQLNKAKERAA